MAEQTWIERASERIWKAKDCEEISRILYEEKPADSMWTLVQEELNRMPHQHNPDVQKDYQSEYCWRCRIERVLNAKMVGAVASMEVVEPSAEAKVPPEFLAWWNQNWPNLCPTQIALTAYEFGRKTSSAQLVEALRDCMVFVPANCWQREEAERALNTATEE